jgi:hypothetical protein
MKRNKRIKNSPEGKRVFYIRGVDTSWFGPFDTECKAKDVLESVFIDRLVSMSVETADGMCVLVGSEYIQATKEVRENILKKYRSEYSIVIFRLTMVSK